MQGLMRHRGTVESDPCHNSIILFQSKCNLCIVIVREIKRDDSKPVLKGLPSHNMCLWNFTYFFKKMSGQCHFLLMDCGNPGFVQISEGSVKSDDTRKIHGTAFVLVREIVRHKKRIRLASGPACNQRCQFLIQSF